MVKFAIRNQGFWLFRYGSTSIPISSFYPSLPHSSYLIFISSLSVNHAIRTICPVTLCSMHLQRRLFNVLIINSFFVVVLMLELKSKRKNWRFTYSPWSICIVERWYPNFLLASDYEQIYSSNYNQQNNIQNIW